MRTYAQQKSALTRAINSKDPVRVRSECERAVDEWNRGAWINGRSATDNYGPVRPGAWPDDWSRWQRALDDTYPVFDAPRLEELV